MHAKITIAATLLAMGCGADTTASEGTPPGSGPPPPVFDVDAGSTPPPSLPPGCTALAQGIYVATQNGHLVPFDPESATFGASRPLCPEVDARAVAMSIDRRGHAWVVFTNGLLYDMDLETGACTVASDAPLPDPYWWWWSSSLSFVSVAEGSASETLFYSFSDHGREDGMTPCSPEGTVAGDERWSWCQSHVATIDTASGALVPLPGAIDAPLFGLHLAGTGGGELWSLSFEHDPATDPWSSDATPVLLQLDKTTGTPIESYRIDALRGRYNYWWDERRSGGLAFWGGRFYIFLHAEGARSASIHRYDPASGLVEPIMAESGLTIADVGVSTCAPLDLI